MKLSRETLAILKNFSTINTGIMLRKGNFIMTRAISGATYAEATIQDEIDQDIPLYDLNGFLNILSLADEDAEVNLDPATATISIKGKRSVIYWPSADESSIVYPKKPIPFPTASVIFELSADDYQQLTRVARGLGIDVIAITHKDGDIIVNGYNKIADSELTRPLYSAKVGEYDGTTDFNFVINMGNMKMLPGAYKVLLWAQGNKCAAKFEGEQASYVLAMEESSSHGF